MGLMIDGSKFAYFSILISIGCMIIAWATQPSGDFYIMIKVLAAALATVMTLLSYLFFRYGYIIIPWITKKTKYTTPLQLNFEIPPSHDVILGSDGNLFYASAFIGLNIFESAIERGDEELGAYTRAFERAISGLRYVTKLSMLVYVVDISKKRDNIKEKIYSVQYNLNREREKPDPDPINLEKLENQLASWQAELERLTTGNKPMATIAYVQTTAVGVSREQATATARRQAEEVKSWIQNALAVDARILTAEDMLRCFQWELIIPKEYAELEQQIN